MKHEITICANSSRFGNIANINVTADFDATTDIKEVRERIMRECLVAGYTAILSYKAIDGDEYAAMILRPALTEYKRLREEVLGKLLHAVNCERELAERPDMHESRREFLAGLAGRRRSIKREAQAT